MPILMQMVAIITLTILFGMLWQLPMLVRGTGGSMGIVVSLIDLTNGSLGAVCALQAATLLPVCWGTLSVGKPTPKTQPMWALTAGNDFICGLSYDSHFPICWGGNANITSIPTAYSSTSYSTINAGSFHVCAVRDSGTLSPGIVDCWGDNTHNQTLSPKNVPMLSVSSGEYTTCGISQATMKVLCWGSTDSGIPFPDPPSDGQFKVIFSGLWHVCGIRLDGYTECWGRIPIYANPYAYRVFTSMAGTFINTCAIGQLTHQLTCWGEMVQVVLPPPYAFSSLSASAVYLDTSFLPDISHQNAYYCGVNEDVEVGNLNCWGTSTHPFATILSSFSASKGICMEQCPQGQYPVLTNGGCPNPNHNVCLDCKGECALASAPASFALPHPAPPPPLAATNITSIASLPFSPTLPYLQDQRSSRTSSVLKTVVPILIGSVSLILIAIVTACCYIRHCSCSSGEPPPQDVNRGRTLINFSPGQIQAATDSYKTEIGSGGYSTVYKGILPNKQIVAVKKLQDQRGGVDYRLEFDMLSKLNHPSLVNLLGYCKKVNALVFPYMENGSLLDRMKDPEARETLSDTKLRLKIAVQVVKGLEYMHQTNVIHRDVKMANILLDAAWNAYLADFGICRTSPTGDKTHCSTTVVGTQGYLDPDYFATGELTTKSDVYGFGVVLLELVSGFGPDGLVLKAYSHRTQGKLSELVDQNLDQRYRECHLAVLEIAMLCIIESRAKRPTMDTVAGELERLYTASFPS